MTANRTDPPTPEQEAMAAAREIHLARHLGEYTVLHERAEHGGAIDIYAFGPNDHTPHVVLVTSGMSERPMPVPPGHGGVARLELIIALPADWPGLARSNGQFTALTELGQPRHSWPLHLLSALAHHPHESGTWLGRGHTVPNGNPALPFAEDVAFVGALIGPPLGLPEELADGEPGGVGYLAVLPVTASELAYASDPAEGPDPLIERLRANGVTVAVDRNRAPVA